MCEKTIRCDSYEMNRSAECVRCAEEIINPWRRDAPCTELFDNDVPINVNPPTPIFLPKIMIFGLAREPGMGAWRAQKPYGLVGQPQYLSCCVGLGTKLPSIWLASRAGEPGRLIFGLSLFYLERQCAMETVSDSEPADPAGAGVHQRGTPSRKTIRSDGVVFFAD